MATALSASPPVVLISCDGLRPDAITPERTPVLSGLIASGAYSATALNEMPPITLPNHASMVTGLSVWNHGVLVNSDIPGRIGARTIFDVAREAGLRVGFFINKSKLGFLCPAEAADVWQQTPEVEALADAAAEAIRSDSLDLVFIHFGEPDGAGHRCGWMSPEYLGAVALVDDAVERVLGALSDGGLAGQATVIVTADHGGFGNTHILDLPEVRAIPFIVRGPGVPAGRTLCRPVRIMDAAATVLHALNLATATALDGAVVTEAFAPDDCEPIAKPTGPCGVLPMLLFFAAAGAAMSLRLRGRASRQTRGR